MENKINKEKFDRLPPQNIEAEQTILGALLIDNAAMLRVTDIISPDSFYKGANKHIYEVMVDLFNKNEPRDVITVSDQLKNQGKLDSVGGRAYINDLAMSVISSANIEYYAKIVAEKSLLRELISTGSEIVTIAYEDSDSDKALDNAEQLIFNLSQRKKPENVAAIGSVVVDTYDMIEKRYNNKEELIGIPSGFYDLDSLTSGFQKSDLIIVAARPSMGKTAFCLNIAQEVGIRKRKPVAFFSLEMSKEQLVQRMLCSEAQINAQRVRTGNLQADDWPKLMNSMHEMGDAPIFIDDSAGVSVMDIRTKCRRLCMEQKELGLIIIDYLQLMEGSDRKKQDRHQEISSISRGLKNLARELNVPIIALSQLSRAVESRQSKIPMLSDLRESGSIEQDADIVIFLYRQEYYEPDNDDAKGKAQVIIAKQRNGPVGDVELLFRKDITRFQNPAKVRTHLF